MKGSIHSDERCPICGKCFKHFEPRGLWCADHPQCMPTRFVVRFGSLTRRFKSYEQAYRRLTGFRYETDMGKFDPRDYRRDNPLGFETLVAKFIESKRHLKAVKKYEQRLRPAATLWLNKNVKDIGFRDIEDLINRLKDEQRAQSYIYHIVCTIRMFYDWLRAADEIEPTQGPRKWPPVKNIMAFRKIVNKDQQQAILEEVRKISWDFNQRIYIGILFLSTYINIRPNELRHIKEGHFELDMERILIPAPKEGLPKYVYLLPDDVALLSQMPKAFPEMYFFRHIKGNGAAKPGDQFGKEYLQRWWNKACRNLGIQGVSLYPGTRHSTAVDLRRQHSPEAVKRSMGTRSNKAFERYLQLTSSEQLTLSVDARGGKVIDLEQKKVDKN